jgi:hypothetical protein
MSTWVDDLRFAEQSGFCVEVALLRGPQYGPTGVHSVDEETGFASLFQPQSLVDRTTRVRIWLPDIASVTVRTDIPWPSRAEQDK